MLGVVQLEPIINSRRCSGTAAANIHKTIKQSTPLTVEQLKKLHDVLSRDGEDWNKAFAGVTLFCVYARSRWMDAQHSEKLLADRESSGTLAFLEAHTAVHKTARSLQLRHVFLPLVSPSIGVTSEIWAEEWLACRARLCIDDLKQFPLMPAPSPSGEPTVRALSSTEAGAWLRMLLANPQIGNPDLKISSHSLKSTCLSYLAKRGISFEDRLALGYHTSALRMTLTYSRDGAARPLAVLCAMLHEIRNNVYKPDETRSGRLSNETETTSARVLLPRGDVSFEPKLPPAQSAASGTMDSEVANAKVVEDFAETGEVSEHVTSGSSSSSEAEAVVKPAVYSRVIKIPNGTVGWQHKKLRTVHLSLQGYHRALVCGRTVGKFHERLEAKPLPFDTPTCRQCFHNKLLEETDA